MEMGFITASLLGGLLYDAFKYGVSSYVDVVKIGLKDFILTEEETNAIAFALDKNNLNSDSTRQQFEEVIVKIDNIEEILKSISSKNNIQNNKIGTVNGSVIGINNGPINMTFGMKN